jgi:hypothetical protein
MSAMDAIEIADGKNRAFCLRRYVPPAGDDIHSCFLVNSLLLRSLERDVSTRYRFAT